MSFTFKDVFEQYDWQALGERVYGKTRRDVQAALNKSNRQWEDFLALISPAAQPYLEEMARQSHELTKKRFGNIVQMYIPLYLSNECHNICTYCGFRVDNKMPRLTLNEEQILKEVEVIKEMGYDHVLLLTGEANSTVGIDYFEHVLRLIRPYFSHISMEVQPLDRKEYERLIPEGLNSVLIYQETYHKDNYNEHHPKGWKSKFDYRLQTPDRLGKAGIHKIGLGALLGLEDWRIDSAFLGLHLDYLKKTYWKTKFSVSFPRLRPAAGGQSPKVPTSEKDLAQLICAYRLFDENVELSLSTRERPEFRDNIIKMGITSTSAGSRTEPGGYALKEEALEQFDTCDDRSPQEVAQSIKEQGYEPVWKDWELIYG